MPFVLAYTKPGEGIYDNRSFPGHIAYKCDIDHSMHLAISDDGKEFTALRNNTGILFPKATFDEGPWPGITKTLQYPWLCRAYDGSFIVTAVRRNENAPDPLSVGSAMVFTSKDLVRYEESGFLHLSDSEIRHPRCRWESEKDAYYLEWETDDGMFCGYTKYFHEVKDKSPVDKPTFISADNYGIPEAIPGNILEITDSEAKVIRQYFDVIYNTGMEPPVFEAQAGDTPDFHSLPRVRMLYSDGSVHDKVVDWDKTAFDAIDFSKAGDYEIPGTVFQRHWDFPLKLSKFEEENLLFRGGMSDPCITFYHGKYYLTSSGPLLMRVSDTLEGVHQGRIIRFFNDFGAAPELHIINDVPYIFTSKHGGEVGKDEWWLVDGAILRCNGEIEDPDAWEAPRLVVRPDGRKLTPDGLSIDISYFYDAGVHYAIWSDRKIHYVDGKFVDRVSPEPADIYIATIDPDAPWQLTSQPQCIIRPMYGWDRCETEVDEGPYILRHGNDLFFTISGSSTGMSDLYTLGVLKAKTGVNLLDPSNWDWLPYPLLTKESVPNQFGPGHNNFVKDPITGDDIMSYHAVPHDANGLALGRQPGMRRVHWAATGLPYLEMTEERDLDPRFKNVILKVTVR